jgi:hypothetical protein
MVGKFIFFFIDFLSWLGSVWHQNNSYYLLFEGLKNEDINLYSFDSVFDSGSCSNPQLGHLIILQLQTGHP